MSNLIIGTSIGYNSKDLFPFVSSLRKVYNEKIILIVDKITEDLEIFFKKYNIDARIIFLENSNPKPPEIFNLRHTEYLKILEKENADLIFITDVRDVIFQGNPFDHSISTELEFFAEPQIIKNCDYNSKKIKKTYEEKIFDNLKNNKIVCAGTTIGTKSGIINYLETMTKSLKEIKDKNNFFGDDQAVHNFLIYNNYFKNFKIYDTGYGPVATLHHLRDGIFNNAGYVLNRNNTLPAVIHQWDRLGDDHRTKLFNLLAL